MTTPVVLVAGFLGAGKTTFVNGLLLNADGRRIAAVVNDFGAIGIDAALLGQSDDGVVSLANGCICCSLQADLMRTLASLTRRRPAPDTIVIETSGASDPAAIVRSLLDPVIYAAVPLESVVTMVDARHLIDRPALLDDPLWRSQVDAADFVFISKVDAVDARELTSVRREIERLKPPRAVFDAVQGAIPMDLILSRQDRPTADPPGLGRTAPAAERFETISWTTTMPVSLPRFQAAIGRLSPHLLRAKGFVTFDDRPARPMLFQMVGTRATIVPTSVPAHETLACRLVLIGEIDHFDPARAAQILDSAIAPARQHGSAEPLGHRSA